MSPRPCLSRIMIRIRSICFMYSIHTRSVRCVPTSAVQYIKIYVLHLLLVPGTQIYTVCIEHAKQNLIYFASIISAVRHSNYAYRHV